MTTIFDSGVSSYGFLVSITNDGPNPADFIQKIWIIKQSKTCRIMFFRCRSRSHLYMFFPLDILELKKSIFFSFQICFFGSDRHQNLIHNYLFSPSVPRFIHRPVVLLLRKEMRIVLGLHRVPLAVLPSVLRRQGLGSSFSVLFLAAVVSEQCKRSRTQFSSEIGWDIKRLLKMFHGTDLPQISHSCFSC